MKILLLNPPSPPAVTVDRRQRCTVKSPRNWLHPPIALAYLASIARSREESGQIKLVDCAVEETDVFECQKLVSEFSPDIIFAQIGSWSFPWDFGVLKRIKSAAGNPKLVVFGELPTAFPKKFLEENTYLDLCLIGEPEFTAGDIIDQVAGRKSLENIAGLAYRDKDIVKINQPEMVENLDQLPFPDRGLLKNEKYHCIPFFSELFTDLMTTRGCPYGCKFCTTNQFWGKRFRLRSPENVLGEIKECIDKYGIRAFFIPDETYTVDKKWVRRLNKGYRKLGIKWALQTRVDLVDKEMLQDMARSGCIYVHYGAESGSQKMLDYYNKNITVGQIKDAFLWTREVGIETNATFIIGNPEETWETAIKTIELAKDIKADYYHFSPLIPHPLSPFYQEYRKQMLLKHEDFSLYVKPNIVFKSKYVTEGDIQKMLKKAYRETIFTPSYILRRLIKIICKKDLDSLKMLLNGAIWTLNNFLKGRK